MGDIRTEPSMEEILASIKRIIADDGVALNGNRPRPRPDSGQPPEPVLELTEAVAPPAIPALSLVPPTTVSTPAPLPVEPVVTAPAPRATPPQQPASAPPVPAHVATPIATCASDPAATLVSEDTACASRQSLSALSDMILRAPGGENTLDGLVRELLRPMLKEWLDARLPDLVETLVAREIARITGKAL